MLMEVRLLRRPIGEGGDARRASNLDVEGTRGSHRLRQSADRMLRAPMSFVRLNGRRNRRSVVGPRSNGSVRSAI